MLAILILVKPLTVPHKWLILKLQAYGVQGSLLTWPTSFLTDGFQPVGKNGT